MINIRSAMPSDTRVIYALVRELAVYENLLNVVDATERMIGDALFGQSPRAFCELAEWDGEVVGFSLWFYNFSTFRGRHGIYLEDLFVRPDFRGKGLGKALIVSLARRCVAEDLARFEWSVLDWNAPSIAFYKALGATMQDDWTGCRVTGEALAALAGRAA
jgi:GNAT superfamily N-acetyltransferase